MTAPIKGLLLSISNDKKKLQCNKKKSKACKELEKKERKLYEDMNAFKDAARKKEESASGADHGRVGAALMAILASAILLWATDDGEGDGSDVVSRVAREGFTYIYI